MADRKIMIVEDESVVALDLQETLLGLGYDVPQPLSTGEKAIFMIPDIEPDLVIMDIKLEGEINGIDAAREIYENYYLPVIFLTAYGDQDTLNKAQRAHPFGYIIKPFNDQQLKVTIEMVFHHHRVEEELRQSREHLKHAQRIAQLGYWEWDVDKGHVKLSSELEEIFGLQVGDTPQDISTLLKRVHPEDLHRVREMMEAQAKGDIDHKKINFRVQTKEGETRCLEASPVTIQELGEHGKPRILAGTVYDVTEYMVTKEKQRATEAYLSTVNRIATAALESSSVHEMLHSVTEIMGKFFDAESCFLTSWEEVDERTIPLSSYGEFREEFLSLKFKKGEVSVTEEVLQRKETVLIENIRKTPFLSPRKRRLFPDLTYVVTPLTSGKDHLGAMYLAFKKLRDISGEMIARVEQISRQVALAIAKTKLLEETKARWKETEFLRQAGIELINAREVKEALRIFLEYVGKLVDFNSACVFLVRGENLYVADSVGLPHPERVSGRLFPKNTYMMKHILESKRSVLKENVQEDSQFSGWGGNENSRGWLGVPLISKEKAIGILTLDHHRAGAFHESDSRLIEVLANQAATAIQKVRLAEAERDQLYITRTLQEISSLLASGLELEDVLSSVLQLLNRVVEYDQAYIAFVDDGDLNLVAGRGPTDSEVIQAFFNKHARSIIDEFQGGDFQPLIYADVSEVKGWISFEEGIGIRSTINAPLQFRGELLGILFVDSVRPNAYTDEMADTVMAFANQASLAINNARLFERNQQLAMTDDLTGVYNRRYLVRFGEREVKRALRFDDPLSMIMLDFDHFKRVNDNYGHAVGDEIIVEVARRCQNAVREIDIVARYGGDEFVIILAKANLYVAEHVARRVKNVVEASSIETSKGKIPITLSVGVTELGERQHTLDELLISTDNALYAAKDAGRNCIQVGEGERRR